MKLKNYIIFAILITALFTLQPIQAQYTTDGSGPPLFSPITIDSPTNITYTTNQVTLAVTVKSMRNIQSDTLIMTYSLDNTENVTILTTTEFVPVESTFTYSDGTTSQEISPLHSYYVISGTVDIENLQSGQHNITVTGQYKETSNLNIIIDRQTIHFTVDIDDIKSVSGFESIPTMLYVAAGVFALVSVGAYVLFVKFVKRQKYIQHTYKLNS